MSTITRSSIMRAISRLILIVLCALCLQCLCSCASKSGDEGVVDHAIRYTEARIALDTPASCVIRKVPDAKVEASLLSFKDRPDGTKEIKLQSSITSDTIASWSADEWAKNRDDLNFVFAAHLAVICKQANKFGNIPDEYVVTCPDYMVVYDSKKDKGFIVSSSGVYQKTDDPENPIGEAIVLAS